MFFERKIRDLFIEMETQYNKVRLGPHNPTGFVSV